MDSTATARLDSNRREACFCQEYFQLVGSHLKENALRNMPKAFDSLLRQSSNSQACDMMPLPQLDRHVFIQVLHDLGNMEVDDKGYVSPTPTLLHQTFNISFSHLTQRSVDQLQWSTSMDSMDVL